jgi:hypothetical protein
MQRNYELVVIRAAEVVTALPADELAAMSPETFGAVRAVNGMVLLFRAFLLGRNRLL